MLQLSLIVSLLLVALAAPASAQTGYGETIDVLPGQIIHVQGVACRAGATVEITFDGEVIATTTAAADGSWEVDVMIPLDATVGLHTLQAVCEGQVVHVNTINVLSQSLPRTGSSNTGLLVGIGLAAVLLGASFLVGRRRVERTSV